MSRDGMETRRGLFRVRGAFASFRPWLDRMGLRGGSSDCAGRFWVLARGRDTQRTVTEKSVRSQWALRWQPDGNWKRG